jgi:hypothetical protein
MGDPSSQLQAGWASHLLLLLLMLLLGHLLLPVAVHLAAVEIQQHG